MAKANVAYELMPIRRGPAFPNIDRGCTFCHKVQAEQAAIALPGAEEPIKASHAT
jgi:hypothetical protein